MVNVLVKEEIILNGVEAEIELLDFIEECISLDYQMFIEEKEKEDTFATINNLFDLWDWLKVDIDDLEQGRLDFISISYINGNDEVEVKLKVDEEFKEFIIGVF